MRVAEQSADHPATGQVTAGQAPASFIWRDRVYVVREVLGYWRERRAWWTAAAARAVHGDASEPAPTGAAGDTGPDTGSAAPAAADAGGDAGGHGLRVAIDHEREVWRVEARGPRTVGTGVYDISREASEVPGELSSAWHLLAVAD